MARKDVIVKVTVSNAGLCFEDDVDFTLVTVPAEMEIYKLQNYIEKTDKELRKENEEGECEYNYYGWNITTLMDKVCKDYDLSWQKLKPQIDFVIQ